MEARRLLASIASGEEQFDSFLAGSSDSFDLSVSAGDTVRFSVGETGQGNGEPVLTVLNPSGQVIAADNGNNQAAEVQFSAESSGIYTAVVTDSSDDEPMAFRIRTVTLPSSPVLLAGRDQILSNGEEVISSFPLGSFNLFPLEVTSGETVQVSVGELDNSDAEPELQVFDENGQSIAIHTSGTVEASVQFVAASSGTYTALVTDSSNDEPLEFRIRAAMFDDQPQLIPDRDQLLANGEEITSSLPLGSFSLFPLEVTSGETVQVSVGELDNSDAEPELQVFDENGQSIAIHTSGTVEASVQFVAASSGTYTALVTDSSNDEPLEFRIRTLVQPGTPQLIPDRDAILENGVPIDSEIPLGSFNLYRFTASRDDDIQIDLTELAGTNGEPQIRVSNPSGQLVAFGSGSTSAVVSFQAMQSGHFTIVVDDSSNDEPLNHRIVVTGSTDTNFSVVFRRLFYKNSAFDSTSDDDALSAKLPLQANNTASVDNFSGYIHGINGLMIDLAEAPDPSGITPADFTFRTGTIDDTSTWSNLSTTPTLTLREGEGVSGSDRFTLTWPDGTITNTWLEVTVRANADTGLAENDIFYFGNQIGDTNGDGHTDGTDFAAIRANPSTFLNPAAVDNAFDLNRDGRVNATDLVIVRDHATSMGNDLPMITPTDGSGGEGEGEGSFVPRQPVLQREKKTTSTDDTANDYESALIEEAIRLVSDDQARQWLTVVRRDESTDRDTPSDSEELLPIELQSLDMLFAEQL